MIGSLRKLLRSRQADAPHIADLGAGRRAYAIGDIHGRLDLFRALIAAIESREAALPPAQTTIILLGDLVDRGPDSAGVLALAQEWQTACAARGVKVHILMGNHEELMLESLERIEVLRQFVTHGGRETILSLGLDEEAYTTATWPELQTALREALHGRWLDFLSTFEPSVRIGDYLFVHAGVRPGTPIEAQLPADMRWIREPFLSSERDHGAVVVHGHTITGAPVLRANRIGIDTGAYDSGCLTALALDGTARWFLSTAQDGDTITTSITEATV
jgi:serine/threonine protein phosphatase 1